MSVSRRFVVIFAFATFAFSVSVSADQRILIQDTFPALGPAASLKDAGEMVLRQFRLEKEALDQPFEVARETESLTGHHITYQQTYEGYEVYEGFVNVHTSLDFRAESLEPHVVKFERPAALRFGKVAASPGGAVEAAVSATRTKMDPISPVQSRPVVYSVGGVPTLGWNVKFDTRYPTGSWDVLVDADTTHVVSLRNRVQFASGKGMVFNPNPVVASGIPDLKFNGSQTKLIDGYRMSATFLELDGSGYLTGKYCMTAVARDKARAYNKDLVFEYSHKDLGFHEAMAYYHLTTMQYYIQSLGFKNINNRQITINVDTITDDNSFYSPATKQITMGTGGAPDVEDADVIYHEAGHAIHDNQVPGWGSTTEGGAMGEGFGDYWAGSAFAGIGAKGSDWDVYIAEWDGVAYNPGNPGFLRRLDTKKKYPGDVQNQVHADGEMWSASLWQVRQLVGKTRADQTVLESHFYLSPRAKFADGANAILEANKKLFDGDKQDQLRKIFVDRGFLN
ncbi:MAG: M36 family metallopeptidase [Bacteriovoracia bacterium]